MRLELPGVTMTRGVDTLLRFRRTMDEILRSGEGGGIKEGDVLIRQNPILFIGPDSIRLPAKLLGGIENGSRVRNRSNDFSLRRPLFPGCLLSRMEEKKVEKRGKFFFIVEIIDRSP